MDLSKEIRERRKQLKLSTKNICESCGIGKSMYYYIEKGERQPSLDTLSKLCIVLSVEIKLIPTKNINNEI